MSDYIGKRIVPKHCGEWEKEQSYEMLCIVLDKTSGDSYISRCEVPAGTELTDKAYWALCSDFSQQIKDREKTAFHHMDGYVSVGMLTGSPDRCREEQGQRTLAVPDAGD